MEELEPTRPPQDESDDNERSTETASTGAAPADSGPPAEGTGHAPAADGDASDGSQEPFPDAVSAEQLSLEEKATDEEAGRVRLRAVVEAAVYITDEPLTARQIADALEEPLDRVRAALDELAAEYDGPEHGLAIRELAEGYKMGTKAEHHEAIRSFVKKLQKPLKLSMAALETLAVVAYKQPITAPEIMEIRGVQGAGVLKTLLDRKLITTAGRKEVVGRPILYKTTKDFLVQFGLKNLNELPTLKEFEELARVALADAEEPESATQPSIETADADAPGPNAEPETPALTPTADEDDADSPGASTNDLVTAPGAEGPEPQSTAAEEEENDKP